MSAPTTAAVLAGQNALRDADQRVRLQRGLGLAK